MGNNRSCELTDNHKERLKRCIITGAQNYEHYLLNKVFKIVCEDGSNVDVRFFQNDYKHLSGLYSNLNDEDFFKFCRDGIIDIGNIKTNQKYNWDTLRNKGDRIAHIHEMLYLDGEQTLLLECLDTKNRIFPYAIRNDDNDICVCFVDISNKARSLRKAHSSLNAREEKKICSVFAKNTEDAIYNELVYLRDSKMLTENNPEIINILSEDIVNIIKETNTPGQSAEQEPATSPHQEVAANTTI